jgi:Domain of unknown function (DUF5664)
LEGNVMAERAVDGCECNQCNAVRAQFELPEIPPLIAIVPPPAPSVNPNKEYPVASGFCDYFPDAILEVAHVSFVCNEQHNPGAPLHWDRSKSTDEADALMRHFLKRGTRDTDGQRHSAKAAWRAFALLQKEIEADARPKS